jgi:hypothetical protein
LLALINLELGVNDLMIDIFNYFEMFLDRELMRAIILLRRATIHLK